MDLLCFRTLLAAESEPECNFSLRMSTAVLSSCQLAIAKKDMNGKHEHYIVDKLRKFAMSSV